jgi:dihydrofolate reductase
MTRNVVLFIAMSLDGYIAEENGDISFLSLVNTPQEDYGYNNFLATIDTVILGRKTYDKVLTLVDKIPYKDKRCIVLSRSNHEKDNTMEYYNGDVDKLIERLREKEGKDIFVDGGSEVVQEFLKKKIIDIFCISIIPVLLGKGISLFGSSSPPQNLQLLSCKSYNSGLVQLWYETKP